jgi:ABC-type transport system substrate-binding protein
MKPAASARPMWSDEAMVRHCLAAQEAVDPEERRRAFAAAQSRLDEEVPLVPFFISHRVAVSRSWLEGLEFGANGYDLGLAKVRRSR